MLGFPLEATLSIFLIIQIQFEDVSNQRKSETLEPFLIQQGSSNTKVQFVIRYTK